MKKILNLLKTIVTAPVYALAFIGELTSSVLALLTMPIVLFVGLSMKTLKYRTSARRELVVAWFDVVAAPMLICYGILDTTCGTNWLNKARKRRKEMLG